MEWKDLDFDAREWRYTPSKTIKKSNVLKVSRI